MFCSVRGRSDGRLEHGDISSFDEVFVLPIDQRVPLVKIILQACEIQEHFFKASAAEHTIYIGRFPALTEMALQEGERCSVAEVHGQLGVDLSLQLHQLPDPVARQEGEVWETLVDRAPDEGISD